MQYFQFKGKRRNGKSADIYALGCCIPEMLALAYMNLTKPYRDAAFERNEKMVVNIFLSNSVIIMKKYDVIRKIEMLLLANLTFYLLYLQREQDLK